MTNPVRRYSHIELAARVVTTGVTISTYAGVDHIVVPVIMLMGNVIVQPSDGGGRREFVPASILSRYPAMWNGRPVIPHHPTGDNGSANDPSTYESLCFGQLFGGTFSDNRLRANAYLNPVLAAKVGDAAVDVITKCKAGDPVEVSIGAGVAHSDEPGTYNGQDYDDSWLDIASDHLAMGLVANGGIGACSNEMGCGAPRRLSSSVAGDRSILAPRRLSMIVVPSTYEVRNMALPKARHPTFKGTDNGGWTRPTFATYVKAWGQGGDDLPSSVSDAPASLKSFIASRTLLGDSSADNFSDMSFFPCVDPTDDKLSRRALRAILGGRGSQASISKAAKESAQAMARSLLTSEFGVKFDTSNNAQRLTGVGKALSALGLPVPSFARLTLPDPGEMSDFDLRDALYDALTDAVPQFSYIISVYPDSQTVIYCRSAYGDNPTWWSRSFTIDDDDSGAIEVTGSATQVEMDTQWKPVAAAATGQPQPAANQPQPIITAASTPTPTAACQCQHDHESTGDTDMNKDEVKAAVERLASGKATDADRALLSKEFGATVPAPTTTIPTAATPATATATAPPAATVTQAAAAPTAAAQVATPPPAPVTLARLPDEPEEAYMTRYLAAAPGPIRDMFERAANQERTHRAAMIERLAKAPSVIALYTPARLAGKSLADRLALRTTPELEEMEALAGVGQSGQAARVDFSGLGYGNPAFGSPSTQPEQVPEIPRPYDIALAKAKGRSNGPGTPAAN